MSRKSDGSVGLSCRAQVFVAQGEAVLIRAFGSGSPSPTLSVATRLPPGLHAVHGRGGLTISGTPRRSGLHFITVTARNPAGIVQRTVAVHVSGRLESRFPRRRRPAGVPAIEQTLTILPESIPAVVGEELFQSVHAFGAPLARLRVAGPLPRGLRATGVVGTVMISGRVARAGTYDIPFVAEDRGVTVRRVVRMTVRAPLSPPVRHWT